MENPVLIENLDQSAKRKSLTFFEGKPKKSNPNQKNTKTLNVAVKEAADLESPSFRHSFHFDSEKQKRITITMGQDGEPVTLRERQSSLGESMVEHDVKKRQAKRGGAGPGNKKSVSRYSGTESNIAEEIDDLAGLSSEFEDDGLETQIDDQMLQKVMALAKQVAATIDKKYVLKVQKKQDLKEHLIACAALRKLLLEGECKEKAPTLNPFKKAIWKKWKEYSEEAKYESFPQMKNKLINHAESAMKIFASDPDFTVLIQKNESIRELRNLITEYRASIDESTRMPRPSTSSGDKAKPSIDDVDAFMKQFAHMQAQITTSYLEMMESLKIRWKRSGNDVMAREAVARKTREDLLTIQDQLVKYQNSLIVYQADINALWQCMIQHQQDLNNDFHWDFVESVSGEDGGSVENGYSRKQKSVPKRISRFFAKKFTKSKRK